MESPSSRRNFLAAGLGLPAVPALNLLRAPAQGLRYRTLGKTGLKVTEVGFGCMVTSDASVIERAADIGINYFDTARGYQGGNNERMVGAALKSKRKDVIISTKTHGDTTEACLKDLETSLRELGTDYIDIWYLHGQSRAEQLNDEVLGAQQMAKKQGKIRFSGASTHGGQAVILGAAPGKLDVVDLAYNFSMGDSLNAAIDAARASGVGIVAMKVMAGGFRKARPGNKVYDTLKREGAMLAALKWVLKNPKVDTTIPSMTDMEQLDENLKAMSVPFSESDQKVLAAQLRYISPLYCRMCGQCEGTCREGLPVADMLRCLTYADGYGQFSLARERFLELPAEAASVRCNLCPSCTVTCPNGVQVSARLSRAQQLLG